MLTCLFFASSCATKSPELKAFEITWFEYFDTIITITSFEESEEVFRERMEWMEEEISEWHQLLDNFRTYPKVANVYVLNRDAGLEPVTVDQKLIDLLLFAKDMARKTNGQTDASLGSVTAVWQQYREMALATADLQGAYPQESELIEASEHTGFDSIQINDTDNSVFYSDPELRLDLGALAKGYVTEWFKEELVKQGATGMLLNFGGNIQSLGSKPDESPWRLGIKNPFSTEDPKQDPILFVLEIKDQSLVTSGDYERFYWVGEKRLNHIIDPDTFQPADYFTQVTIVGNSSAWGDVLSTALFCEPIESGEKILANFPGMAACWVFSDGSIMYSENWEEVVKAAN